MSDKFIKPNGQAICLELFGFSF